MAEATSQSNHIQLTQTTPSMTMANHWDHFLARLGIKRDLHKVSPGLYNIGIPAPGSPVFVTANYSLSFDALRSSLKEADAYILVLNTLGINVWCAAGKGTFGTEELLRQIDLTNLKNIVNHHTLILPQLGAPGVSAPEVKKQSGFRVKYGPIRAKDIPEYMQNRKATPEMRKIDFPLYDRAVLIPVELNQILKPMLVAAIVFYLLGGLLSMTAVLAAVFAGIVLFPILLPFIPTSDYSSKGFMLGGLVALVFSVVFLKEYAALPLWYKTGWAIAFWLSMTAVTAYLSLNFTGATPFTSRTGVKKEIDTYIPGMAIMAGVGLVTIIVFSIIRFASGEI